MTEKERQRQIASLLARQIADARHDDWMSRNRTASTKTTRHRDEHGRTADKAVVEDLIRQVTFKVNS